MTHLSNEDNFKRAVDAYVTKAKFRNVKNKQTLSTSDVRTWTLKPAVSYIQRPYDSFFMVPHICFSSVPLQSFTSVPLTAFSSKREIPRTAHRSKPSLKKCTNWKQTAQPFVYRSLRLPDKVGFINTKDGENNERSTELEPSMPHCLHNFSNQRNNFTDKLEKESGQWTVKSFPGEKITTDQREKESYKSKNGTKDGLETNSYPLSFKFGRMPPKPLLDEKESTGHHDKETTETKTATKNGFPINFLPSLNFGRTPTTSFPDEKKSIGHRDKETTVTKTATKNGLEINSCLNRSFNTFHKKLKPPEFVSSINKSTLGHQIVFCEGMDELELPFNAKPPQSLTFEEYQFQKIDQTSTKLTKSGDERKSNLQVSKENKKSILEIASKKYDCQNDSKMCSNVQILQRSVNFQAFYMNEIDKSEKNIFHKKIRTLKNKLDSILVKFSKTDLKLSEIFNQAHERVLITSHRRILTYSDTLYSNELSRLSFSETLESLNTTDAVLPHIFPKASSTCIFSTHQDICRCNDFQGNHVPDTASYIMPYTSKTHISEGKINEECNEGIVINLDTLSYLHFELQKSQQLLSDIEKSYDIIRRLFESSWSVKSKGFQNMYANSKNGSNDKNIYSCGNLSRCLNNSTESVVSELSDSKSAEFLCSTKDDASDHSNEESEACFSSKCTSTMQMRLSAKRGIAKIMLPTHGVPPVQTSKNILRGKITVYKSVFSKNIEKPIIRSVDAFSLYNETLNCKIILNSIEKTYETVKNEISSWLRDMKSDKVDEVISRNLNIGHDARKQNLDGIQPEDKGRLVNGDCLMRFKAGNFNDSTLDWSLDDTSDSDLSIISEEGSEMDDSESSLDGSFRHWRSDSRGSTDSEDSDCVSIPDTTKTLQPASDLPRIFNFSADLKIKIKAKAKMNAKSYNNVLPKSVQENPEDIGSMLLQSLQHLCHDKNMKGVKN